MRIQKFQADEELQIHVPKCLVVTWVGLQDERPTILAVIGEEGEAGTDKTFFLKMPGDKTGILEMQQQFMAALVSTTSAVEYMLYGEKPSLLNNGPLPPDTNNTYPGTPRLGQDFKF